MVVKCRMHLDPEGRTVEYESDGTPTYEDALLSIGIIPDLVLILFHGESLPQDKPIEEDEVTIVVTESGCW